ncbi:MAG: DUF3299 domain-containing protein [Pirellulales bacterium]|nr:DUF3299 domain-containing protein [Pirellulales bacterium]
MTTARLMMALILVLPLIAIRCQRANTNAANPSQRPAPQVRAPLTPTPIRDKTFDDIKFEMAENAAFQQSLLTPEIEQLFGKRIRIRGYIFPTLKKHGLTRFVLVRDNLDCCFGPGAALFDCIVVEMQEGQTAEYTIRPVAVEGTFGLKIEEIDNTVVAIYRLEGERVE